MTGVASAFEQTALLRKQAFRIRAAPSPFPDLLKEKAWVFIPSQALECASDTDGLKERFLVFYPCNLRINMDGKRKLHAFFAQMPIAKSGYSLCMGCLAIVMFPSDDTDCVLAVFVLDTRQVFFT